MVEGISPALAVQASTFLIVFVRVGAVLMLLPIFSDDAIPTRIRLMMALGFSAAMLGMLGGRVPAAAIAPAQLPLTVGSELLVGIAMGAITRLLFQAAAMAGSIASLQIGLSSVITYDASQGGTAPVLSRLVSMAAALACMAVGIHHLWIAQIVHSYDLFPVGAVPAAGDMAELAVRTVGRSLSMAVGLAAPFTLYGIVFNVALGMAARLAPAVQIFFMMQPLNILFGLALTAAVCGSIALTFADRFAPALNELWS